MTQQGASGKAGQELSDVPEIKGDRTSVSSATESLVRRELNTDHRINQLRGQCESSSCFRERIEMKT